MNYLLDYGLSKNDIQILYSLIKENDWYELTSNRDKVKELFDYFKSIGFTNFKGLLFYKIKVIYLSISDIKKLINMCNVSDIIDLVNKDISNFDLIGL